MTTLTLRDLGFIGGLGGYDTDALTYITAVETADGQSLEVATKDAINAFVVGCKADGIWSAIKASCILAGARTLTGALVPLVGTAPTNFNFVSGDYDRKTGLVGDGSTKYLNSNRNNNADPQDSNHNAVYVSNTNFAGAACAYMGADSPTNSIGANNMGEVSSLFFFRIRNNQSINLSKPAGTGPFFLGGNRVPSGFFTARVGGVSQSTALTSQTTFNGNLTIFATAGSFPTPARIAFYSIGEALDLALLDARVTALITEIGAAF
jgi:hypothetical protein